MNNNSYFQKTRFSRKPSRLYLIIPLTFLIVYAVFLIGRSFLQHYQINRQLDSLTEEISDLKDKSKRLQQAIKYYHSASFKEKEARAKLGYQKKGETAIALPPSEDEIKKEQAEEDVLDLSPEKTFTQPNYIRWWNFFFKGE